MYLSIYLGGGWLPAPRWGGPEAGRLLHDPGPVRPAGGLRGAGGGGGVHRRQGGLREHSLPGEHKYYR